MYIINSLETRESYTETILTPLIPGKAKVFPAKAKPMIIKETKYLTFEATQFRGRKTKVIHVCNRNSGHPLATIEWYGAWRQYCFIPNFEINTIWNNTCLSDVISVINQLMKEREVSKPIGD